MYPLKRNWKYILTVLFVLLLLNDGAVWMRHSDHASAAGVSPQAVTVYGQGGSFTTSSTGTSTTSLDLPKGIIEDSSGGLYVADTFNNRVLYFPSGSTTATRVYGQGGSFTSGTANNGGVSATSLSGPTDLALDSSGDLYVSDVFNNRVLYYPSGSTTATRVYGQGGSFTSSTANNGGISANSLNGPNGLALDSSGNLYIADYSNNRILYYPSGSTTATRVYGQGGSFTSNTANNGGISANSIYQSNGLALDSSGNLYIADSNNNRILYYPSGSTTATRVYGQGGSFTSGTANNGGISANSLDIPTNLALDSSGDLYVTDRSNNRVLYYPSGSTTATRVYGQNGSFTSNTANNGGISATSLNTPFGITIDNSGNLFVAEMNNSRVLKFQTSLSITTQPPTSSPSQSGFSTTASLIDVGSGATFTDFSGTVSAAIKSGTGTSGATLWGTTSVSASSGVATFSNLSVNLTGSGYVLTLSSAGFGSANTSSFTITNNTSLSSPQAVTVFGQGGSFTSNTSNNGGISANSLNVARTSILDSSGNRYVADTFNNRVLYYPSGSTTATRVYGQNGSFTSNTVNNGGVSANSLETPTGIALDSSNNLYIADDNNNRILYYPSGSTTATRVYGQAGSFTSNTANNGGVSANSLNNSNDIALDSSGNLYVTDYYNNRVLYYPSGSTTATRVYGQNGSFTTTTSNNGGISAKSLFQPGGITLDSSGNLYVGDTNNNRILYYPSGSTTATRVYGQNGSFTSNSVNNTSGTANTISATSLNYPIGVDLDSGNNLYIADTGNNRVLYYPSGSMTATRVYGQAASFTTTTANTGGISAMSLAQPFGVNIDSSGNLYVADASNSRVLEFQTALSITSQPPSSVLTGTTFSTGASLIDVGSGVTFTDFNGTVSAAIKTGTSGATLSGTTSVSASSGVATFSNLSINLSGSSYTLSLSSLGANSATTSSFGVLDPAGYWHFDENSGTTASDSSPNHNNGTLTGGPTWTSGEINSGLSFNGSSNYVTMGTPSTLQFGTGSFTAMAWFKTTNTGGTMRIINQGVGSWNGGYNISMNALCTGCISAEIGGTGTAATSTVAGTSSTFNDGKWHQVAMVVDQSANTVQLYVDGVAQTLNMQAGTCGTASGTTINISSCTSLTATTTDPFIVGGYQGASSPINQYFSGSIDEVRVYGGALGSSQVQNLYTNDTNTLSEYTTNVSFSGTVGSTTTYTLPIALTYQLTPAPGWNLLITSTTLTNGSNTLPTTASKITSVTGACTTNGTCSSNALTNTVSSFPLALPAATTAPTAVKFFGTAAGTGTGAYTVTPTFSITVPITAKPGTYSSIITVTAVAGP